MRKVKGPALVALLLLTTGAAQVETRPTTIPIPPIPNNTPIPTVPSGPMDTTPKPLSEPIRQGPRNVPLPDPMDRWGLRQDGEPQVVELPYTPDLERGRKLWGRTCAGCHGPKGNRVEGHEYSATLPQYDVPKLLAFLASPTGDMPSVTPDPLDDKEVQDVVAYVFSRSWDD